MGNLVKAKRNGVCITLQQEIYIDKAFLWALAHCMLNSNSLSPDPASGASDDYYQSEGTRFSYTPELRDDGFGFLLPPQYIIPSGEEIFAALSTMLDKLLE